MKKIFLYFVLFFILAGLGFVYYSGKKSIETNLLTQNKSIQNFYKVKDFLSSKTKYPIPEGDLILLDKKGTMIHLEDRNATLSEIKNLYAIQGTTCDIFKDDKKFQDINYDLRYSILDKKTSKPVIKRCFTYSVTKDQKHFQIGTIDNKKTLIVGNSSKSIIKAYDAPILLKNGQKDFLPYPQDKLSPIFQVKNLGNTKLLFKVSDNDFNEYIKKIEKGNNVILSGNVNGIYQIKLTGKIDLKTELKFIDTNGSIVYIKGDKNGNIHFELKDYKIDTNRINYIVETGKFLADIIKLSPDKTMNVSKQGTTLVIRGTKFSIDSGKDSFDTYLVLGKILEKLKDGKSIDLTKLTAFSSLFGNKLIDNAEKLKQMVSFIVYNDITNYPKYNYTFTGGLSDILFGGQKILKINYENGQNIGLINIKREKFNELLDKNKLSKDIIKKCNGKSGCLKLARYNDFVNNYCKKNRFREGLDIDKLYYLLNIKSLDRFTLKDKIKNRLGVSNYVLLTNRKGGVNGSVNQSTRVGFTYNGQIEDISLRRLEIKSVMNDIENIIISCE